MSKLHGCSRCCHRAVPGCTCECLSLSPVGRGSLCPALQPGPRTLGMLPSKACSKPLSSSHRRHGLWFLESCSVAEVARVHQSDRVQILLIYTGTCVLFISGLCSWMFLNPGWCKAALRLVGVVKGASLRHSTSP